MFLKIFKTSRTSYFGGIGPCIFIACVVHEFFLVSQVWKYTAAENSMNKGSQLSVSSFCCCSTVALACREGTTMGLFIPSVIRLTVGTQESRRAARPAQELPPAPSSYTQSTSSRLGSSSLSSCLLLLDSSSRILDRLRWGLLVFPPSCIAVDP